MKKILNEFKKFISKGNALDLAVGVVVGGAFSKIVSSLVNKKSPHEIKKIVNS